MKAVSGVYKTFKCTKAAQPIFTKMQQHFSKMNGGKGAGGGGSHQSGGSNATQPVRQHVGSHQPHKAPEFLAAFPDAQPAKRKTSVQGGGKLRERWKDKKHIYEWDTKKGTVEKYSKAGKEHLGEFNSITGEKVGDPVTTRKVEP